MRANLWTVATLATSVALANGLRAQAPAQPVAPAAPVVGQPVAPAAPVVGQPAAPVAGHPVAPPVNQPVAPVAPVSAQPVQSTAPAAVPTAQPAAPAAGQPAPAVTAAPAQPGKPVAVVNGEPITAAELDRIVDMEMKTRFRVLPATEMQRRQLRLEVAGMLVDDLLMQQFLRTNGPKVEPAEVDKQLADLEANLKKQTPPRSLQDFYRETNQTEPQLKTEIYHMLQWTNFVKAHHTEADDKRYYDENKEFFDQVKVRASHIMLHLSENASPTEVQTLSKKLLDIKQEIVAGKIDFAEAAKKHSQCSSAPNGGDIGYFSRKWMLDEAFAKAAWAMKVGEISDVVKTDFGLHIIKVTDRKPGQPSDYEKIKDEVREFCVEEMRQNLLSQQRKAAKVELNVQ